MHYVEEITITGRVSPAIYAEAPVISKGRIAKPESLGNRVHHGPVEMNRGHGNLTLKQTQERYGSTGRFTRC